MEQHGGTASLRSAAPQWSLAGDKKLLQLLQNIHEKVVTKCKETNTLLDQMITSLDDASIDVQTVNNRFMSLSNSQFVERRVYSDDADVTSEPLPNKEVPRPATPRSELTRIKSSLGILEKHHEMVEILPETDSDSDDDELTRVVFKPRNVYADRPLPHIIGSQEWRKKWHAGTLPSDSDTSEPSSRQSEYSESDHDGIQSQWPNDDTLSSVSSEVMSPSAQQPSAPSVTNMTPAQIADELARRLGNVTQITSEYEKPKMDTSRINKPDAPLTANIFPEEPPPITQCLTDTESEGENDIFAELHKNKIYEPVIKKPAANRKQTQDLEDSESELFKENPLVSNSSQNIIENAVKKPIGAISMFGSSQGTESIGAAILKRNQKKASSDEDSEIDNPKIERKPKPVKTMPKEEPKKAEKDIFEDLFAKSQKNAKKSAVIEKEQTKIDKPADKKVDLFSDNIFDDIDDIFTSNIVSAPKNEATKQKSIFEDDDELFSEVAVTKPTEEIATISGWNNNDSDDQLFSENTEKALVNRNKIADNTKSNEQKSQLAVHKTQQKESKSIFDDSSDEDLFVNFKITMPPDHANPVQNKKITLNIENQLSPGKYNSTSLDKERESTKNSIKDEQVPSIIENQPKTKNFPFQSPSLFDDEDQALFLSSQDKPSQVHDEIKSNIQTANNAVETVSQTSVVNNASVDDKQSFDDSVVTNKSEELEDRSTYFDGDSNESNNIAFEAESKENDATFKEVSVVKNIDLPEFSDLFDDDGLQNEDRDIQKKRKLELEKSLEDTLFARSIPEEKPGVSDLFAEPPPLFEKPKEPKKSKNVNALFDDDSDDEALFFKKDLTLDENPEDFESAPPVRFGIFQNEPPDFDVDFAQKSEKVTKSTDTLKDAYLFSVPPNIDTFKTAEVDEEKTNETSVQSKKVGKLKPLNLNINVNTLLPGASPKKTQKHPATETANTLSDTSDKSDEINIRPTKIDKTVDNQIIEPQVAEASETDGQIISTDTKSIPKSVSFEGDPESNVLDNKLSKERAKIQVKRRPSSRRARHEAVRKSIRENHEESCDSTDNSTSIDDHKPTENKNLNSDHVSTKENQKLDSIDKQVDQNLTSHNISVKDESKEIMFKSDTDLTDYSKSASKLVTDDATSENRQKDVKSKVVYVLNDEDIFTNTNVQVNNSFESPDDSDKNEFNRNVPKRISEEKPKILTIIDDDDDESLFKQSTVANKAQTDSKPITNLAASTKSLKTNLFEDSSDDETLFKPKTQLFKKPTNLFGSDSDDDIFSGKKKETKDSAVVYERKRENVVKKNLFSDDEGDDDLFGAKSKTGSKDVPTKSTVSKTSPNSLTDPLSTQDDFTF